jgi:hypothetical protein
MRDEIFNQLAMRLPPPGGSGWKFSKPEQIDIFALFSFCVSRQDFDEEREL